MLKKCYGLFLGLVVLAGSACVTPTHASSATVIITNVRAGGQASALEEGVVLYNNSPFEANVTDWCVINKLLVEFACFTPRTQNEKVILPGYSYATVVSSKAVSGADQSRYSIVYESSASSSGTIVAGADSISLINEEGVYVDQVSWSSSISSLQQLMRMKLSILPDLYLDNNSTTDWQKVAYVDFPSSQVIYRDVNAEEPELPEEPTDPIDPIDEIPLLAIITELLPNAVGSDTGNEFIEIFNPNEQREVILEDYRLAVGPAHEKVIKLDMYVLKPLEYKVFTNTELAFSLLNTSSSASLTTDQAILSSEVPAYASPPEGESWALIDGTWQYTNQPTPGFPNILSVVTANKDDSEVSSNEPVSKPCASNQYRSPETNRCRLISTSTSSSPVACKAGQERNPETNRCRTITVSTSVACKEGQERNPETNRCRNIKQLSTADYAVKGSTTQQQSGMGWYMWAAIAGIVLLIIGYAVWEWRDELKQLINALKAKFAGKVN
jgi:hypothetical protein